MVESTICLVEAKACLYRAAVDRSAVILARFPQVGRPIGGAHGRR
jgi:hypothetical protein